MSGPRAAAREDVSEEVEMENVIVGYDGSDQAKRALDRAAEYGQAGAKVTVVSTAGVERHSARSMGRRDEDNQSEVSSELDEGVAALKAKGVHALSIYGEGDAADVLIEAAKEAGADLVIVGTRGLGGAKRALLGSTSTKVAHNAPCDVLIVR